MALIPIFFLQIFKVLEKVHVDIQGPFPIASVDGTKMNIKAVDSHSGYVEMELIHDKSAATTSDFIQRFHVRSERQTGSVLKIVCTDSGNEFNGSFLLYLEQFGITKRNVMVMFITIRLMQKMHTE